MTIPALTKPVDELTAQDIRGLVTNQIQEGEHVEFKEGLSSSGNAGQTTGQIRITNEDKAKVIKEIVAFANSYGGRLFIGIEEDGGNPPVAASVTPLADSTNLADRLGRACAALIDPPMLRLDVTGIATEQDGSGVIVFDVPRSIRAPHMSNRDYRSYRRRGSESVPMDMRDIQDMTLRLASRQSEIEAEFERRNESFMTWNERFRSVYPTGGYCLRLSYVPLDEVYIGPVHSCEEVVPQLVNMKGQTQGSQRPFEVSLFLPQNYYNVRPIVRGTRLFSEFTDLGDWFSANVWENGGLEIWFGIGEDRDSKLRLHAVWLGCLFANGLRNVERIRRFAGVPLLSYGLEAQLSIHGKPTILRGFGDHVVEQIGPVLPIGNHVMPRSEVGPVGDFDGLLTQHFTDWFNLAGFDWDAEISVDYRLD